MESEKKATDKGKKQEAKVELDPRQKRKENLENLLKSRFFYTAAYEIYGGVKGLYDYGPPGCSVQANILQLWREWFILEDSMQQISTSALTPEVVFQTSGHIQKFQDHMVRDVVTGECYRADHLLEAKLDELMKTAKPEELEKLKEDRALAGGMTCNQLSDALARYKIVAPDTGNALSEPFPFNLMFQTQIGPTGKMLGFLRPETAQGMFVNFHRLLEYNGGRLPFATAQIGPAFRNEIAPRSGLLRVREFTLAEIEHFLDPANKSHEKFDLVRNVEVPLLTRARQLAGQEPLLILVGEATDKGIINNQTLAYYLARTYLFLLHIGIQKDKVRFREHMEDEMAHYACGCFDAEIYNSYGWIECVGLADRSAYDLSCHQKASGQNMQAFINHEPIEVEVTSIVPNKQAIGKQFKKAGAAVIAALETKDENKIKEISDALATDGSYLVGEHVVTPDMIKIETKKVRVTGRHIVPNVIEPAFGIGRILYSVLDQSYYVRPEDEQRCVLALKPQVAPFLTSILPLLSKDALIKKTHEVERLLKKKCITTKVDTVGVAIGRRYARTDELGIPFAITIDFETLENDTVTLRERDSTEQVRVPLDVIAALLISILQGEATWDDVKKNYPSVAVKEDDEKADKK